MEKIQFPCVILCGGKSSRMGTNKALLPFGDYKIISYQYIKLTSIFQQVFISLKDKEANLIFEALNEDISRHNLSSSIILDKTHLIIEESDIFAPIVGILHSLNTLESQQGISKVFFISCDCPLVKQKTFQILCANSKDYDITYAKDSTLLHPLVGIWDISTKTMLKISIESCDFKIMDLLSKLNTKAIYFDKAEFVNINTKKDYKKILQHTFG